MNDALNNVLNINLLEYAYQRGYTKLLSAKESATWVSLKNPSTGDHIRIKTKSNPMLYNNNDTNLNQDRGNIINFVINRLESNITQNPRPDKELFKRAFTLLKSYNGDIQFESRFESVNQKIKNLDIEEFVKLKLANLRDCTIQSKEYLKNIRKINPEILSNPIFLNKIKESPVSSTEPNSLANICFVKTELNGTLTGIVTQYHNSKEKTNVKRVYEETDNIWISNRVEQPKNFIYGESVIDCLSHYEIYNAKSSCYASFEGQTSEEKLNKLYHVYQSLGLKATITSITDNDYNGNNYDMETAVYFYNKNHAENPINKTLDNDCIKYTIQNHLKGINIGEIVEKMSLILKLEAPHYHDYFKNCLKLIQTEKETILFVPYKNNEQKVSHFLKPLVQAIHFANDIKFFNHKSKNKDWNEDLQQIKKNQQQSKRHSL
ncbi:Protein of unknown function [Flavobacterium frigidimaris]|nr:Protein of unknown function [Flavobacterium frigidimaris]